ncbi:unnamed protein product, partial [Prorocentrum cordatum]
KSAGALRKWTKPKVPWEPLVPQSAREAKPRLGEPPETAPAGETHQHVAMMDPQTAANAALQEWESIWRYQVDWAAPWFEPPAVDEPMLPPILGHHALHSCKAFSGLGESNIHPRLWAQGPAVGLAGLGSILNCIERGSDWPVSQQCIIFWLQPKPKGGVRNLGLLPELARVWEKIRRPDIQKWQNRNPRAYDWAAKGRSAERAAWMQGLLTEGSLAQGEAIATTYYDLRKCYETVLHSLIWSGGLRGGFPKPLLRVILSVFSSMRRAVLNGCYTEGNFWAQGIVAGSVFGPLCLSLVLIGAIDDLRDVAAAAALHTKLTDEIAFAFEQVLKLQVSRGRGGKTVVAVSHGRVERQFGNQNKQMGIQVVREAVHLGVTQSAARRRRVGAQSKRTMEAKARSWNIQRVKAAGGAAEKVVKLGIVPSELYGTRVQGATDTLITTLRQTVAAAFPGCNKGRSAALVLLAEDADPAVLANAGPIVEWARAWQEATDIATRDLLVASWRSW